MLLHMHWKLDDERLPPIPAVSMLDFANLIILIDVAFWTLIKANREEQRCSSFITL